MTLSKAQPNNIISLFSGNKFFIPDYQRKYSWGDRQCKELWDDISSSSDDNVKHNIGTLSLKEKKDEKITTKQSYEIIDGQQRVTSLFILLKAMIDKLENEEIQKDCMENLIGYRDDPKLSSLGTDREFLMKIIFEPDTIDEENIQTSSQRKIFKANSQFTSLLERVPPEEIEKRVKFISENITFLVFAVEKDEEAIRMFSSINDRGLPLKILDKVKSSLMLYSLRDPAQELYKKINKVFQKIFDDCDKFLELRDKLGILGKWEENTIFSHHYFSARTLFSGLWNKEDGVDAIYEHLKNICDSKKNNPEELKQFITDYLNDFQQFTHHYFKMHAKIETISKYEKPFRFLEFSTIMYPLLVRLHMQNKLNELLPLLEAIEVRVYKIKATTSKADIYNLSNDCSDLEISEINKRLTDFGNRQASKHYFKNRLIKDPLYRNGATKYILHEYGKGNRPFSFEEYDDLSVEHIFAQEPDFAVSDYGFNEDTYDSTESDIIGNMTLLEKRINAGIGNIAPQDKANSYLRSKFAETKGLGSEIDILKMMFNKENIDARTEKLSRFCLRRFKI